jgi:flavin-dependent dehydrogenase
MTEKNSYDVVVVGGGVAGTAAAVAAARNGASVLLVERNGCLGGWQTAGLVSHFSAFLDQNKDLIVFGFVDEVVQRLVQAGGSVGLLKVGKGMVHHDPEILKLVLEEMVVEAGVEPLYYAEFHRTLSDDGVVNGVELLTRSGLVGFPARGCRGGHFGRLRI